MTRWNFPVVALCTLLTAPLARADIYRWDTGELIPGTEGVFPGPEEQLDHMQLEAAMLADEDLTEANLEASNLMGANLESSILTDANLRDANLRGAGLSGATLAGADFSGAIVASAGFVATTSLGFTAEQLYSTGSYQTGDLQGMQLGQNDLSGWNFAGKNLRHVYCEKSTITNADLSGADLTRTYFAEGTLLPEPGARPCECSEHGSRHGSAEQFDGSHNVAALKERPMVRTLP